MTEKNATKSTARRTAPKQDASANSPGAKEQSSLDFAVPDFAGIVGAHMEGAKAMGDVSSMLVKTAQDLAARQAAFVKSTMETVQKAASGANEPDISVRLEHQSETYRELMEASVQHFSEVAETFANCCCDMVDHIAEAGAQAAEKSMNKSGA
ncbi:phasin family protein [Hyphococcus sp.]|uniref:phasin family protein n=1 Tax=Hyphococcus sp. TaxID=2038636 RepID=UPI003D106AD9